MIKVALCALVAFLLQVESAELTISHCTRGLYWFALDLEAWEEGELLVVPFAFPGPFRGASCGALFSFPLCRPYLCFLAAGTLSVPGLGAWGFLVLWTSRLPKATPPWIRFSDAPREGLSIFLAVQPAPLIPNPLVYPR